MNKIRNRKINNNQIWVYRKIYPKIKLEVIKMNKRSIQAAILVIMLLLFNIIGCTEQLADSIAPQPTKAKTKYISAKSI